MPLVTVTLRRPRDPAFKRALLDTIHAGLVSVGVPEADRFQRVQTLAPDDFRTDARYPDLAIERNDDFVLIEILWSVGRSVKVKRALTANLVAALARAPGLAPDNVMIVFIETAWENWAFGDGRLLHAS
jgi:phenylpyruvate tautomerase PptA (4-oxalocrotonate tautomerase family)